MPATEATVHRHYYYPARIALRVPAEMQEAVTVAARLQLTSPSEYLRRAVLAALKTDGLRLGAEPASPVRRRARVPAPLLHQSRLGREDWSTPRMRSI